jgi:NAD(P)-dependent dehydrogenase (short-subunit alcohol dehydrogenase family)
MDYKCQLSTTLEHILSLGEKISHLFNNTGVVAHPEVKAISMTAEAFSENVTTNVLSPVKMVKAVLPLLAPRAVIVKTTSRMASLQVVTKGRIPAAATAYSGLEAAPNMVIMHQAQELKGQYRVACLDPVHDNKMLGGDRARVESHESAVGIIKIVWGVVGNKENARESGRARFQGFLDRETMW